MGRPPADADPEKFIFGRGGYSNLRIARPYYDEQVFRIDPEPMPWLWIGIYNLFFASFFLAIHLLLKYVPHNGEGPWVVYGVPIGFGLLTGVVFTALVYHEFARANRLGPWLIYNRQTGSVALPREGMEFQRQEIVHLQYITTKRLSLNAALNNDRLSELNLVTCRDGERKRWPLLRSIFNVWAFDRLLKPLLEQTNLPVVRVTDEWLGWKITEKPYGRE